MSKPWYEEGKNLTMCRLRSSSKGLAHMLRRARHRTHVSRARRLRRPPEDTAGKLSTHLSILFSRRQAMQFTICLHAERNAVVLASLR